MNDQNCSLHCIAASGGHFTPVEHSSYAAISNALSLAANFMKAIINITLFFIWTTGNAQQSDTTWFAPKYLQSLVDTGTYLPAANFIDIDGHNKTLADYKGKVLYISIWAASCGNSIEEFPYQEQLLKRLKAAHIDSFIELINIHVQDSKKDWQKAFKKHHPPGVNLFCSDTSILTKWNLYAPPSDILIDGVGKVLGKDLFWASEIGSVDYILYSAVKGIHPSEALLTMYNQDKLMEQYKSSSAFTDPDYKNWFDLTIKSFIDFQKWRNEHQRKKQPIVE